MHEAQSAPAGITETVAPGYAYTLTPTEILADLHSPYQHIQLIRTEAFGRVLVLDGSFQCSEVDEASYHEPLVHAAMLACDAPRRVLIIGGGDGGAAEEVLKHPDVQRLVHVELDGAVVDVCRQHLPGVHGGVLDGDDRRHRLLTEDGFAYLDRTVEPFDVIVLDLTDPGGPSSRLYSAPFFALCAQHLAPGGALSLHVGSAWAQQARVSGIAQLLRNAFDCVRPMLVNVPLSGGPWMMAVATQHQQVRSDAAVTQRLSALMGAPLQAIDAPSLAAIQTLPPGLLRSWLGVA